ncbi:T9SS type A sorting domain-containing protein [Hymenobacter gummosus]|nr:T9SS type A sorting domain-containing protein [Hymenobacter gummosus]
MLAKAITMSGVCTDRYDDQQKQQDIRDLNTIDAKFIGRAAWWWNSTYETFDPHSGPYPPTDTEEEHFRKTLRYTGLLLGCNPGGLASCTRNDRIVQAGIFEYIGYRDSSGVLHSNASSILIPDWVYKDWGLTPPMPARTFIPDSITYTPNDPNNPTANNNLAPDVTKREAKLWIYYRACMYMACGIEALHMGPWDYMAANDKPETSGGLYPRYHHTKVLFDKIREFAANGSINFTNDLGLAKGLQLTSFKGTRNGYVVLDPHSKELFLYQNASMSAPVDLFDFYSFPLDAKRVITAGRLGTNSFYTSPTWGALPMSNSCNIPDKNALGISNPRMFLVELDNALNDSSVPDPTMINWGFEEITWFAAQPCEYRADWLRYMYNWLKCNAPNINFQMPGRRKLYDNLVPSIGTMYRFNVASSAQPYNGSTCGTITSQYLPNNQTTREMESIRELWSTNPPSHTTTDAVYDASAPALHRTLSNIAIEEDGSLYWVDAATGQIKHAQWDAQAATPHWVMSTIPNVTDAADNLMFQKRGRLFYRSTSQQIKYCQYNAGAWTVYTVTPTNTGPVYAAGSLVFEASGPMYERVPNLAIYYRAATTNHLEYVKETFEGSNVWGWAPINPNGNPITVAAVEGAIACPTAGTVIYIAQPSDPTRSPRLTAVHHGFSGWTIADSYNINLDAVKGIAIEKRNNDDYAKVYCITWNQRVAATKYYHGWNNGHWVSGLSDVDGATAAWGDIQVTGENTFIYRSGTGITSMQQCGHYYYPDINDCQWGLVRQADNSLYYVGVQGEVRYVRWDHLTCSWNPPSPRPSMVPLTITSKPVLHRPKQLVDVEAYPNPANTGLTVELKGDASDLRCQLQDALGRTVAGGTRKSASQQFVDTRQLPNGIYYLHVQVGSASRTQKIVVAH